MHANHHLDRITKYSLLVFAFSIPWSSALYRMSVLMLCICFAIYVWQGISGQAQKYAGVDILKLQPSIDWIWPLALTAWVCLSWFWTSGSLELYKFDAWRYVKLSMIPVIGFFIHRLFHENELQVIKAFGYGIIVLMIPTYLDYLGVFSMLGISDMIKGDASYSRDSKLGLNLVYWHNQIVHGFHVAILFAISILTRPSKRPLKYFYWLIAGLCVVDILFLIIGKMALFSLLWSALLVMLLTLAEKAKLKYLVVSGLAVVLIFSLLDGAHQRILILWQELSGFFSDHKIDTSIGNRLHYWEISLNLFLNNPIIGNGAGSFRQWLISSNDPLVNQYHYHTHNEYLTQLSQFGLIGLCLFFGIFYCSSKSIQRNPNTTVKHCVSLVFAIFLLNALSDSSLHNEWEGWTLVLFSSIAIANQMQFKSSN